jgi:hypothetical protein
MKMATVKTVPSANPFLPCLGTTPSSMIKTMSISPTAIRIPTATYKISSLKWRATLNSGKFAIETHSVRQLQEIESISWPSPKITLVILLRFRAIAIKGIRNHNRSHSSRRISLFLRLQRHSVILTVIQLKS